MISWSAETTRGFVSLLETGFRRSNTVNRIPDRGASTMVSCSKLRIGGERDVGFYDSDPTTLARRYTALARLSGSSASQISAVNTLLEPFRRLFKNTIEPVRWK